MTDDDRRRGQLASAAKRRKIDPARLLELHSLGLTDRDIARHFNCSFAAAHSARSSAGLPLNVTARSVACAAAARKASLARGVNRRLLAGAECASLGLPPLPPLGVRAVSALTGGPLTRSAIGAAIGYASYRGTQLARLMPALRGAGVVQSFRAGSEIRWSLAPAVIATAFGRVTLRPLQRSLAADPQSLAVANRVAVEYTIKVPHLADDIRSAAFAGVADAARLFDPANGTPFLAYVTGRVRGSVLDALRESGLRGFKRAGESAPKLYTGSAHDSAPNLDAPESCLPVGWEVESEDAVHALTRPLSEPARSVVRWIFSHGMTHAQVAARLGVSATRVTQIASGAIAELRESAPQGDPAPFP